MHVAACRACPAAAAAVIASIFCVGSPRSPHHTHPAPHLPRSYLGIDSQLPDSDLGMRNTREYHLRQKGALDKGQEVRGGEGREGRRHGGQQVRGEGREGSRHGGPQGVGDARGKGVWVGGWGAAGPAWGQARRPPRPGEHAAEQHIHNQLCSSCWQLRSGAVPACKIGAVSSRAQGAEATAPLMFF